jgi:hypothetical protein
MMLVLNVISSGLACATRPFRRRSWKGLSNKRQRKKKKKKKNKKKK